MPELLTANAVSDAVMPPVSVKVRVSLSKIVIALAWRFSFDLSDKPSFEDNPCFRIRPDTAPMPPETVKVLTSTTVSTI